SPQILIQDDILLPALTIFWCPSALIQSIPVCKFWLRVDVDATCLQVDITPFRVCSFFVSEPCVDQEMNQVFLIPSSFVQKKVDDIFAVLPRSGLNWFLDFTHRHRSLDIEVS